MKYAPNHARYEKERQFLDIVFAHMPEKDTEYELVARQLFTEIGSGKSDRGNTFSKVFVDLGIIERRYVFTGAGKTSYWKRTMDLDEARSLLMKNQEQRLADIDAKRRQPQRRTKRKEFAVANETVAIVGPDEPTLGDAMPQLRAARKDESEALIEATRQYVKRHDAAFGKLQELADTMHGLGVAFDIEKARSAFIFEPDDRLEAIALVLPVIDRLERTNAQLAIAVANSRDKIIDYGRMKAENERLVKRVEALVSQRVMSEQAQASN